MLRLRRDLVAKLSERGREDAGDLWLRDAQVHGDPLLAPVLVVAEDDDEALPPAEGADPGMQEKALVRPVDLARRLHALERLLVERNSHPGAFDVRPSARTPTRPRRLVDRPPELPEDRGNRIRPQVATAALGEAVDRLDEPDRAGLDEVVHLIGAAGKAAGDRTDEGQVLLDDAISGRPISTMTVLGQQKRVGDLSRRTRRHEPDDLLPVLTVPSVINSFKLSAKLMYELPRNCACM